MFVDVLPRKKCTAKNTHNQKTLGKTTTRTQKSVVRVNFDYETKMYDIFSSAGGSLRLVYVFHAHKASIRCVFRTLLTISFSPFCNSSHVARVLFCGRGPVSFPGALCRLVTPYRHKASPLCPAEQVLTPTVTGREDLEHARNAATDSSANVAPPP